MQLWWQLGSDSLVLHLTVSKTGIVGIMPARASLPRPTRYVAQTHQPTQQHARRRVAIRPKVWHLWSRLSTCPKSRPLSPRSSFSRRGALPESEVSFSSQNPSLMAPYTNTTGQHQHQQQHQQQQHPAKCRVACKYFLQLPTFVRRACSCHSASDCFISSSIDATIKSPQHIHITIQPTA